MSLPVPLAVRVGDQHITRQVQSLGFRKEAIGGVRSITFSLARSLADLNGLDPMAKVFVYDTRSGETKAEGRLTDSGRGATQNGPQWDCLAFGPAQRMSDITAPYIYIDRSVSDGWMLADVVHTEATIGAGSKPGDSTLAAPQGVVASFSPGVAVNTNSRTTLRYKRVYEAGQVLAAYQFNWTAVATTVAWRIEGATTTDGGAGEASYSATWNTAGGSANALVGTNFPAGRNMLDLRIRYTGGAATTAGETWGWFDSVIIRPQLMLKNGTLRAAADHLFSYILAHDVVEDLLGRWSPTFDRANAIVDQTGAFQIQQLAYPDGVNGVQVLEDLMAMNPTHRWYTTPDTTGGGYGFRWEPWPTTVRYEATLDDGGSFPLSAQDLYNAVSVRWTLPNGTIGAVRRTSACPILDKAGITRHTTIDLAGEAGSAANAAQAGDAFLAQHNVPSNSGTLTIARPIRDVIRGCDVMPWEIEAGELVRVRGVEAYTNAFNASTNDGVAVFRIFAVDYASDGNTAALSLDSDPHTTEDALVKLLTERTRR